MGNKPPATFASEFTRRAAMHSRVAYYPYPDPLCGALVKMVVNEILVGAQAAANAAVTGELINQGASDTGASVFDDNDKPGENVSIWRLASTPGTRTNPDVAEVVWAVRPVLAANGIAPEQVAPNHILIAAPNFHDCPFGPPSQHDDLELPGAKPAAVDVTVIDAGYDSSSPIAGRVTAEAAQWFTPLPPGSKKKYGWGVPTPSSNPLDENGDGRLDALVGHANFVAGVVWQACQAVSLTVVSHNAAFVEADDEDPAIPTEASVARSLWKHREAHVINVGFAFPTLPDAALVGNETDPAGPKSWSLDLVLRNIRDRESHVVVAPAGNQDCTIPQYPAAFGLFYPNVVGVGSLEPGGGKSGFSNHGSWVTCSTEGEDVTSTFISGWTGPTEELDPGGGSPAKDFNSGWASWSGTSFAAPKIAGAIAELIATGVAGNPLAAWNALKSTYPTTAPGLGHIMRGLPPL